MPVSSAPKMSNIIPVRLVGWSLGATKTKRQYHRTHLRRCLTRRRGPAKMMNSSVQRVKDIELVQPPSDSVSKIEFSPTQDILAVASWDNNVRGLRND